MGTVTLCTGSVIRSIGESPKPPTSPSALAPDGKIIPASAVPLATSASTCSRVLFASPTISRDPPNCSASISRLADAKFIQRLFKMKHYLWNALLVAVTLTLAACSSSNTVSSAVPGVDFSQYKSYGFMTTTGSDGKPYQSLETGYLRTAVSRELDARSWSQSNQKSGLFQR